MVFSLTKNQIYIYNCDAANCSFGVNISHNKESVISILNNTFNNMTEGISISDVSSEIYIQNNTVSLSSGQGSSSSLIGVQVLDNVFTTGSQTTYICDNTINNSIYGIIGNHDHDLQVINNIINQNAQASSLALGIVNANNHSALFADNHIESPSSITLTMSMAGTRIGIHSSYTDFGRLINNHCIHNGSGMYFLDDNTNIEIGLNKLTNNWYGIYGSNVNLGPNSQGQANNPWNNEWTGNIGYNIYGSGSPTVDWYYQNVAPFDPTVLPGVPIGLGFYANPVSTTNGNYNPLYKCISGPVNPPGGVSNDIDGSYSASAIQGNASMTKSQLDSLRFSKLSGIISIFVPLNQPNAMNSSNIGNILSNASFYQNNSNVFYNKSRAAYYYLSANSNLINLGTANDIIYKMFYKWMEQSNIGKLDKAEKAMFAGDTAKAAMLLNSIAPQNYIELISLEVYGIYNKSWAAGSYSFTPADSATLQNIAYQDPATGGPAVYLARNMLGLTLVDFGNASVARKGNTSVAAKQTEKDNIIMVYPNPAADQIFISFGKKYDGYCEIYFYNIFGQQVMHQQLSGSTKYNVNISALKSGLYFYSIVTDGNILKSDKFIKQ